MMCKEKLYYKSLKVVAVVYSKEVSAYRVLGGSQFKSYSSVNLR